MSDPTALKHLDVWGQFSQNLGPRKMAAGLRLRFHYDQFPGIHFKADVTSEYREGVTKGIKDGMSLRFPDFPESGSVWITEAVEHPVDSSEWAFYLAARCAIEVAYALVQLKYDKALMQVSDSER